MAGQRNDAKDDAQEEGKEEGCKEEVRTVTKQEAAFILGSGGKTKAKLSAVSGAQLDIIEDKGKGDRSRLEIHGTKVQCERAKKYIDFVVAQRLGPVKIEDPSKHDDLTLLLVPADAVSFITGKQGSFLRFVEEEWGTLLFFLQVNPKNPPTKVDPSHTERLAIFGTERNRRGAELKVMAAVEVKQPGYFSKLCVAKDSPANGFDTDTVMISEEEYSYALGKNGATRKKLARAANCIIEYVGHVAFFSGTKGERERAKEYMHWLLNQRAGGLAHVEQKNRDDVTVIMVPRNCIGFVRGHKGVSLRNIEEESNTFCFIDGTVDDDEDQKELMIFGRLDDRRIAETLVWEKISQKIDDHTTPGGGDRGGHHSGGKKGKGRNSKGSDSSKGKGKDSKESKHIRQEAPANATERVFKEGTESHNIPVTDEDAAFLMGPSGKTKRKIEAVSGAQLELKSNSLNVIGTKEERDRATKYVNLIIAQRMGPVALEDLQHHDDLSILEVPAEAVSFVTGKAGSFLRLVEEEFGTMLFFIDFNKMNRRDQLEKLAIFGAERERRGAELKVMAAIEMKLPGHFTNNDEKMLANNHREGFSTELMKIDEEDYSYALGKGGATRKKIARASGCIIEYIGRFAYLSGLKHERTRAREYLHWLFQQRIGPVEVDYSCRDDVTVIQVPKDCVGYVTGHKGASLRSVEEATDTFCFIEGGRDDSHRDPKPLLIFGSKEARREAETLLRQKIDLKLEEGWVPDEHGKGHNEGKGDRRFRDGPRRPKGNGRGGKVSEERSSTVQAAAAEAPAGNGTTNDAEHKAGLPFFGDSEDEDDGVWGDWGGGSFGDKSNTGNNAAAPPAVDSKPQNGHSPAKTHQPAHVKQTPPPARSIEEDFKLPPQLLHEEAWPELGSLGQKPSPKKGKTKK